MTKRTKKAKKTIKEPLVKAEGPQRIKKTKIRIIGIGGGGGSIVSELALRVKKATFIAANTDFRFLKGVRKPVERFRFGESLTHGLGTGMNPELGEMAALSAKDSIKKLFENQDISVLIATLGGGAGSGASPIFAKIAKGAGALTFGIFTLPFKFEGEKKMEIARVSLEKLKPRLNALTIIPNDRIFQLIDKDTPLNRALSAVNKRLAESLEGLLETIYTPGLINIDFADLKTILQGQGRLAYLNVTEVKRKEGAAKEAVETVINSPLYPYSIKGAKGILFNIVSQKDLSLAEVNQISRTIHSLSNKKAKIIFGISQGEKYGDIIKTTLLALGCSGKFFPEKPKKKRLKKNTIKKPTIKVKTGGKKAKKKLKIKVSSRRTEKPKPKAEETEKKDKNLPLESDEAKVRRSALQIRKETEEAEKEILAEEKLWEPPAFLRRKNKI